MSDNRGFETISNREQGLRRQLTSGQMSMIAIGGAIGTGLFMGSALPAKSTTPPGRWPLLTSLAPSA